MVIELAGSLDVFFQITFLPLFSMFVILIVLFLDFTDIYTHVYMLHVYVHRFVRYLFCLSVHLFVFYRPGTKLAKFIWFILHH